MHNPDVKHLTRPGFKPSISKIRTGLNEPSEPACFGSVRQVYSNGTECEEYPIKHVSLMFGQRRRQWINIKPTLGQRLVFQSKNFPQWNVPALTNIKVGLM